MSLTLDKGVFSGGKFLAVGFVDTLVPTSGFIRFEMQLSLDGEAFADLEFTDPDLARAALRDSLFTFQPTLDGDSSSTLVLRYMLDLEGPFHEAAFQTSFVAFSGSVPEADMTALVAAALFSLSLARRLLAARGAR